jgi:hypothetical protein
MRPPAAPQDPVRNSDAVARARDTRAESVAVLRRADAALLAASKGLGR